MELNGKVVAEDIKKRIGKCDKALIILSSEEDKASLTYIKTLERLGKELGVIVLHHRFKEVDTTSDWVNTILRLNIDDRVGSILVMKPLPPHLDGQRICNAIKVEKDIDCQGSERLGIGFASNGDMPCTAMACISILNYYNIDLSGKKAVIVGRSNVVGKPLVELLLRKDATVTICHSKTKDLKKELLQADVIFSATGVPHMITPDMVNENAVIVDAGISFKDGKICGDVHPDVYDKVYAYTPVPNGVGAVSNVIVFFKNYYISFL